MKFKDGLIMLAGLIFAICIISGAFYGQYYVKKQALIDAIREVKSDCKGAESDG